MFDDWRSRRNGVARALTCERQTLRAVCKFQSEVALCIACHRQRRVADIAKSAVSAFDATASVEQNQPCLR